MEHLDAEVLVASARTLLQTGLSFLLRQMMDSESPEGGGRAVVADGVLSVISCFPELAHGFEWVGSSGGIKCAGLQGRGSARIVGAAPRSPSVMGAGVVVRRNSVCRGCKVVVWNYIILSSGVFEECLCSICHRASPVVFGLSGSAIPCRPKPIRI